MNLMEDNMGLPKGFRKDLKISPHNIGPKRRQEILDDVNNEGTFLPSGVGIMDMDKSVKEFIEKELELVIDGKKVPVIMLSIQRWAELSKTWDFNNKFKDLELPFISIVRQPDVQVGTNYVGLYNIPGHPTYTYCKIPINEGGRKGFDLYQIPQPTSVNINYEIRLFCDLLQDVNTFSQIIHRTWNARQAYIKVKGHPMPLIMEGNSDESQVDDFQNRRFYVNVTEITLEGYLLDEKDFKVIPTIDRGIILTEIDSRNLKPKFNITTQGETFKYDFIFSCSDNTSVNFSITNESEIIALTEAVNAVNPLFTKNGNPVQLPFNVNTGDNINIKIERNVNRDSSFILIGKING